MATRAVISLTTGSKDTEKVTVAFLVAVGAAEQHRPTPTCFTARHLHDDGLLANAALGGTVPMWEWIGDEPVTTFSY